MIALFRNLYSYNCNKLLDVMGRLQGVFFGMDQIPSGLIPSESREVCMKMSIFFLHAFSREQQPLV